MNGKYLKGLGKLVLEHGRRAVILSVACVFAACSSGSDESGTSPPVPPPPPPPPAAPVASAGVDRTVQELVVVDLTGAGTTDANGDPITYSWTQTAGIAVTLGTPDMRDTSFTAPDVTLGNPVTLTFELTASDPGGLSTTDTVDITVQEAPPPPVSVTISGVLRYEFVPPNNSCRGLNYSAIQSRPIRRATVQLLDATGMNLLGSVVSGANGAYTFTVDPATDYIIRVRAELKGPSWDVEVRNNVDTSASPPPLENRPLYVMDQAFNSGVANNPNMDLTAVTGWGGDSYTGDRVAAPFAILDTIYSAIQFVAAEDAGAIFPPLDAFWSADNKAVSGTLDDDAIARGDLPTSFYLGGQGQLFLLGMDGGDTEEFDDHVITHEWSHYFEDNFSRSDNIGGSHFLGRDLLDKRVAFGEGFANAMSAMTLNDPLYCDTSGFRNQSGFGVNMENSNTSNDGWFDEVSVLEIIYDLWDTDNDGTDNSSIGFGPIYDVMTGPQATTPAFTSIFSFATYLKQQNPGQATFIDALLIDHGIVANGIDIYGDSETNDGPGSPPDVLPIYTDITLGVTTNICVNNQFDNATESNRLSEHRYLRLNLAAARNVNFQMVATSADGGAPSQPTPGFDCSATPPGPGGNPPAGPGYDEVQNHQHSDPDMYIWQSGIFRGWGASCDPNSEETNAVLQSGMTVIDIQDWRHEDDDANVPADYPEQVCYDFTAN